MLFLNITSIYLKCGVLLDKSKNFTKNQEYLKYKFKYINPEINMTYKNKILFLFKISYFRIDDFIKSPDFEFLKNKINVIQDFNQDKKEEETLDQFVKNGENSKLRNNNIKKCYYCGELTGNRELLINKLFQRQFIKLENINELIIKGIDFLNSNKLKSFFNLPKKLVSDIINVGPGIGKVSQKNYIDLKNNLYPYIMTSGQEGISIYRVDSINSFKKIGGNSFGPSTLWSLFTISCGYEDPDLAVAEAAKGNNKLIDLSVGDIYGGSYENMSLSSDLIGSSFCKFANIDYVNKVEKKDLAKSLVILYGATYSHVTCMVSSKENIDKVIITGNPFYSLELFQIIQTSIGRYSNNYITSIFNDYSDFFEIIGMVNELDNLNLID